MRKYYVYIHVFPDGKRYVGSTSIKPEYRWNEGRGYKTRPFYEEIEKVGWNNISHELYEVGTPEEMYYLEKYLIAFYNTRNPEFGYNVQGVKGKKGPGGWKFSEETKAKMSKARKGIPHPKYKYLFPDGRIRELAASGVGRHYTSKGIKLVKLD